MNKKAVQLSANFLVIMIIAIAVFSMGIKMAYDLMTKAEEIREDVDESTQREIEEALTSGEIVSIPLNRKTGKLAKSVNFGLGLFNTGNTQDFSVTIGFEKAFSKDREDISSSVNEADWIKTDFGPYEVERNANRVVGLPVRIPRNSGAGGKTPPGTYIFKVTVKDSTGSVYGSIQKVYVEVI